MHGGGGGGGGEETKKKLFTPSPQSNSSLSYFAPPPPPSRPPPPPPPPHLLLFENLTRFQARRYASSAYDDVVVDDQDVAAFHVTSCTGCKRVDSARIECGPHFACSGTRNHIRPASSMTAVQSCLETEWHHRNGRKMAIIDTYI